MSCRVDERVAVGNLKRIANDLRAVIGLGDNKVETVSAAFKLVRDQQFQFFSTISGCI